jgi:hypothetical protein
LENNTQRNSAQTWYLKIFFGISMSLFLSLTKIIDAAQLAEAVHMLNTIFAFRTNYSKGVVSTAEVSYTLAMLFNCCGDKEKGKDHATKALAGKILYFGANQFSHEFIAFESTLGREHTLTIEVRNLCKTIIEDTTQLRTPTRASLFSRGKSNVTIL